MEKLCKNIKDDEINHVVFFMNPWKAPGLDGFHSGFYQKLWNIVGRKVYEFVKKVWEIHSELAMVNQTNICLIPKTIHPEFINQFRPISLCNVIYKVVSKFIVEYLNDSIPKLVYLFQSSFVSGQNICKNIKVAQEIVHNMNKMKGNKGFS